MNMTSKKLEVRPEIWISTDIRILTRENPYQNQSTYSLQEIVALQRSNSHIQRKYHKIITNKE